MDHPVTTARLVEPGELKGRGVTAVLDRAAIEESLRSGERDQLLLDVARGTNGEVEAHVVRVDLAPQDLERILTQTEGDRVALDFDGAELEDILGEADVEGHGLREKALVFSVAAVTAVGAAGGASGAIPHVGSSAGEAPFGAVAASAGEAPAAVTGAAGQPEAPFGAVAASAGEAPAAVTGAAGQPEAPFGAVAASDGEAPAAVVGGAGEPASVPVAEPSPAGTPAAPSPRGLGSASETGGAPDPALLAGLAGGLGALAITAVAFARRREQEPRST
jgi:hypothetical protein